MSNGASQISELVAAVVGMVRQRLRLPLATYRAQFAPGQLGFADAARLVPYLRDLGVSHLYSSPCLRTRCGAAHGYAVVDYGRLNHELGSDEDYRSMVDALHAHGMGQILDIVPNHMSTAPVENAWWTNVLENGPSSPYATYFDIDWQPVKDELKNKVLLPVLGNQYGRVLEAGELKLQYRSGAFYLHYFDTILPLDPRTYRAILTLHLDEFKQSGKLPADSEDLREIESIVTALEYLPDRNETDTHRTAERQREKEVIKRRLARLTDDSPAIDGFIQANLREFNGDPNDRRSFDLLDGLVDDQVYRLAHWRAAADEINYRRFFDINELAAVCMEHEVVFEESHRFVFDLLVRGDLDGVRIDHIDGLYNPSEYLWRLQWGYLRALGREAYLRSPMAPEGPAAGPWSWEDFEPQFLLALYDEIGGLHPANVFPSLVPPPNAVIATLEGIEVPDANVSPLPIAFSGIPMPLYVVVEKILNPEEPFPEEWPAAGTTGYEFLNFVNGLFIAPDARTELIKIYNRVLGETTNFREIAYQSRLLILRAAMSSELQMLAYRLNRISEKHRLSRDFTLNSLRVVLREILACFPIYRTYIMPDVVSERDRRFVHLAVAQAKRRNPAMDRAAFDFARDTILLEQPLDLDADGRRARELFVGRFQQVTSPVMAKGIEDTAFYRYNPLISANEVGGEPARAVVSVAQFHDENITRNQRRPHSIICTSTHDTKRSEDVRARINVLSELPHEWRKTINRWMRLNRRHIRQADGDQAPSRNDQYLFYQALVGVWPVDPPTPELHARLIQRMQQYMEKSTHEAKVHTSWIAPNGDYDAAVREFVAAVLDPSVKNRFLAEFRRFHDRVIDWGLYTAISQLLLKLASPGVADIYQGQEIWDFSLVDPDNRRPVDFDVRRWLLDEIKEKLAGGDEARRQFARQLGCHPSDNRLKLYVTREALAYRGEHSELFHRGRYVPLAVEGDRQEHVCAFAWRMPEEVDDTAAIVIAPRLLARLTPIAEGANHPPPPFGDHVWNGTSVNIEPLPSGRAWRNIFTGKTISPQGPRLLLADALSDFPVALLDAS